MLRLVSPAGAPLTVSQILRALLGTARPRGCSDRGIEGWPSKLHVKHILPASSGRVALWVILSALHQLRPSRDVVALPAYTCFSVLASIVRAGLKAYLVDVDPRTLDFDFSLLEDVPADRLLCVVTSNLFGIPNDMPRIRHLAETKNAFVVDDAAQALGASRNGCLTGTMGDAGFYSFARGKAIAAEEGALIVTDSDELAGLIRERVQSLGPPPITHSASLFLRLLVYAVFLRPRLYWLPNSLPFLKLGTTEFDPGFPGHPMPSLVQELLPCLINELEGLNQIRRQNASVLAASLQCNSDFAMPQVSSDSMPNYIRFPLIARDQTTRDLAIRELRAAGIGASSYYPTAACDIPGIEPFMARRDWHCPNAEDLSRRLLTLPTHPYVQAADLKTISRILAQH